MEEIRELLEYKDYGYIEVSINKVMKKKGISPYSISKKSNISYKTIKRLMDGEAIERVELDILARLWYMFDCELSDLIRYVKPKRK